MAMVSADYKPAGATRTLGRYLLGRQLATGGMASVSLGKLRGDGGFSRVVAVKRMFPQYAKDPEFVRMFLDEARLASRVRHPNVVGTLDVESVDEEIFLVMEYVAGESLGRLLAAARSKPEPEPVEASIAGAIMCGVLEGLHAAHLATDPRGVPLNIVHRDVSPQNVLVGVDGVPRVVDFGVAKAVGRMHTTQDGQLKGKLVYMPPEQIAGTPVDRRSDVWSAGVVLWEMLAGRMLFGETAEALKYHAKGMEIPPPGEVSGVPTPLDAVVLKAVAREPDERYQNAREMLVAIEKAVQLAPARRVGQWVQKLAKRELDRRASFFAEAEAMEDPGETASGMPNANLYPSVPPASFTPPPMARTGPGGSFPSWPAPSSYGSHPSYPSQPHASSQPGSYPSQPGSYPSQPRPSSAPGALASGPHPATQPSYPPSLRRLDDSSRSGTIPSGLHSLPSTTLPMLARTPTRGSVIALALSIATLLGAGYLYRVSGHVPEPGRAVATAPTSADPQSGRPLRDMSIPEPPPAAVEVAPAARAVVEAAPAPDLAPVASAAPSASSRSSSRPAAAGGGHRSQGRPQAQQGQPAQPVQAPAAAVSTSASPPVSAVPPPTDPPDPLQLDKRK